MGAVITGRVTDAVSHEPVAGAAVLIEGTSLRASPTSTAATALSDP